MIQLILEHRTTGEGKVVNAPDLCFADLRDWIFDNHRGWKFAESRPIATDERGTGRATAIAA